MCFATLPSSCCKGLFELTTIWISCELTQKKGGSCENKNQKKAWVLPEKTTNPSSCTTVLLTRDAFANLNRYYYINPLQKLQLFSFMARVLLFLVFVLALSFFFWGKFTWNSNCVQFKQKRNVGMLFFVVQKCDWTRHANKPFKIKWENWQLPTFSYYYNLLLVNNSRTCWVRCCSIVNDTILQNFGKTILKFVLNTLELELYKL